MALLQVQSINESQKNIFPQTICPHYKFTCDKWWHGENECLIFKADKSGVVELTQFKEDDIDILANKIIATLGGNIPDRTIISGGHTVINLLDRYSVSDEVTKSTELTFKIISRYQRDYDKKIDFLVQLNDLYMERDMNINEGSANKYRKEALNPYIVPDKISNIIERYNKLLDRKVGYYYCAEKNMADTFKRHIKTRKKQDVNLFKSYEDEEKNYWTVNVNNEEIVVLLNNKPNCVAANAAMLRAIRYDITSNRIRDNFESYIGLFPLCSIDNVLNGYKVAVTVYDLDLPSYYIFYGKSCF